MGAKLEIDRRVRALDSHDALHQACHCVDRDLEEILARINTINVSEVIVEFGRIETVRDGDDLWNPEPFDRGLRVPPHIIVQYTGGQGAS